MAMQGPISTPVDYSCGSGHKPSGSPQVNGEAGLPPRSAHPMGVDEVVRNSMPAGGPDTSGRTIDPVLPPLFKKGV